MDSVVAMREVDVFEDEVSAYPAVTVLRKGPQGSAKVVEARSTFDQSADERLVGWLFEDPRTRVGIGVASGCDAVFVVREAAGVEESRLLPTVTAADIAEGDPRWGGRYLVNPWEDGRLVDLADFPGMRAYLENHGPRVRSRHVARRRPGTWYRTIDRVDPTLLGQPKLLLPDIKAFAHPVLEPGELYPHHNLYYVVSGVWDLEVLGGLLLSDASNLFVGAYCVKRCEAARTDSRPSTCGRSGSPTRLRWTPTCRPPWPRRSELETAGRPPSPPRPPTASTNPTSHT